MLETCTGEGNWKVSSLAEVINSSILKVGQAQLTNVVIVHFGIKLTLPG